MYKFVNRDEGSSVYGAVTDVLLSRPGGNWLRIAQESQRFNLILAERNRPSYARLGHHPGIIQAINYYRGSSKLLCRKVSLVCTIRSISDLNGLSPYSWMPRTFIIVPKHISSRTTQIGVLGKERKCTSYRDERNEFLDTFKTGDTSNRNIWIAKSNAGAKGESIFISSQPDDILRSIDGEKQAYVIQKYIERPLLLDGRRKFDIRMWVLLDHEYNIHVFSQGVLRTSSESYDVNNLTNMTSHLTNHCVQESKSQNFGKYEKGNEMFFDDFSRFLRERHGVSFEDSVLPQIYVIIKECLLGIKEEIETTDLCYHSFQLFGFDFMIDDNYKVWLLEINGAPASASDLLQSLAIKLVTTAIDPIFPPTANMEHTTRETTSNTTMSGDFIKMN